jgi:hypothetical protein
MEETKVNVSLGYTLNLGNFQSLRIDIGIQDSKRQGETTGDAFDRVYSFVESRLLEKVKEGSEAVEGK